MKKFLVYLFLLQLVTAPGCQNEATNNSSLTISEAYFADYESPKQKWGYVNLAGETVIKPVYDDARDFQNNLAAVNFKGRWGFINTSEKVIHAFEYKQVSDFSFGRAFAQNFENKWYLIDSGGKLITALNYSTFKAYKSGYCAVSNMDTWGIIDSLGNEIIPCRYESIELLENNEFIASEYQKYGILNFDNDTIVPFIYERIWPTEDAIFKVKQAKKYKYLKLKDNIIHSPEYEDASLFYNGKAMVKNNNAWLLIDTEFKTLSEFNFKRIEPAGQNFWKYKEGKLWGLLSSDGKFLSDAKFELLNNFSNNRAAFMSEGYWGYINGKAEVVISPVLPIAWDFQAATSRIIGSNGFAVMDTTGHLIFKKQFRELRDFHQGLARFQSY